MADPNIYKQRMFSAVVSTCVGIVFLMMLIKSSDGDGYRGFFEGFDILDILLSVIITVAVSAYWIRFIFAYVDFSMEEMISHRRIAEIAIQEQIKKLQEKD